MRPWLLIAILVVAACRLAPEQDPARGACENAFGSAMAGDEMHDSVEDFFPAVRACESVADWSLAFETHEGAGFVGSATQVLRNICLAEEIANEPLCREVAGSN